MAELQLNNIGNEELAHTAEIEVIMDISGTWDIGTEQYGVDDMKEKRKGERQV